MKIGSWFNGAIEDKMIFESQFFQSSEEIIISKAIHGELEAFNQLVNKYQGLVYNHAYAISGDRMLSEDAAQESFIKAYKNLAGFRGTSLRAWLLRITSNTVYDMLRKPSRSRELPLYPLNENGEEVEFPTWLADQSQKVQLKIEQVEEANFLYHIMDSLPEVYRSVLTLVDLYDFGYQEAAQVLKIPIGTVKSRLARARWRMKGELQFNPDGYQRPRSSKNSMSL